MTADELKGTAAQCDKAFKEAMEEHTGNKTACDASGALSRGLHALNDHQRATTEFLANGLTRRIEDVIKAGFATLKTELAEEQKRNVVTVNGRNFNLPEAATVWRIVLLISIITTGVVNGCGKARSGGLSLDPATVQVVRELAGISPSLSMAPQPPVKTP